MKTNRSLLILAAAFATALFIPVSQAQTPAAKPDRGERPVRAAQGERGEKGRPHMAAELGLTDAQKTQMQALQQQQRAAMEALANDTSLTPEQKKAKRQELFQGFQSQRQAILTPEQQVKAQEMRANAKQRGEKMQQRREKRGPGKDGVSPPKN